jgi:two-component system sensor histidine kinase PilS (NtrC family)
VFGRRRRRAAAPGAGEGAGGGLSEESWFSSIQAAGDGVAADPSWSATHAVLRPLAGHALRRIFATYVAARAALGVALIVAITLIGVATGRRLDWPLTLCSAYVVQAITWWATDQFRTFPALQSARWQWWMTIGVDLLAFGAMHWVDPTSILNFAALLVLPVLMAGILTPRTPALATAAGVALMLLAAAGRVAPTAADPAALMSQAGLNGVGLFVVSLLAGELSMRLAHEERTARDSRERARQQAQLSRLVIEDMSDGVLVIDRQLRVRAANPSARKLLVAQLAHCPSPPFSLRLHPGWLLLADEVEAAFQRGSWPSSPRDLNLQLEDGSRRALQMRARFTRSRVAGGDENAPGDEPLCVVFVEELKAVQARLKQERLAAMGRISAGVAHEIRNPLAAIAQANALLEEDDLRADQRRLVRIMADNIGRLRRIVDDVMEAAPGSLAPSRALDATAEIASICSEWARTVGLALGSASRLQVLLPATPTGVAFDPDHLRRVLVNLLDNAVRHAGQQAGAVRVELDAADAAWARLAVASDGAPIPAEVEPYLFEPFHSTRSRGTGLGLYICRELCERHSARIDFRRHDGRHCNVFEVMMLRESLTAAEGRLVL